MLRKNRLFTPGPTPILPAAQTAMASFAVHHRTADFRALFQRVLADMKDFIGTQNDVLVLASSGTGVMEGAVSNLTSPARRRRSRFHRAWHTARSASGRGKEWRVRSLPGITSISAKSGKPQQKENLHILRRLRCLLLWARRSISFARWATAI